MRGSIETCPREASGVFSPVTKESKHSSVRSPSDGCLSCRILESVEKTNRENLAAFQCPDEISIFLPAHILLDHKTLNAFIILTPHNIFAFQRASGCGNRKYESHANRDI